MGGQIMQLTPEHKAQIGRIIGEMKCPRETPCYTCDFETLGRARPIGDTGVIDCLEERGGCCPYGLPFGDGILCMCPLRKYLAEHGLA